MKSGKKKGDSADDTETTNKPKANLAVLPSLICLISPVIFGLIIYISTIAVIDDRNGSIANMNATLALQEFEQILLQKQESLNTLGASPYLGELALQPDAEKRAAYAAKISNLLPETTDFRIITRREARINNNIQPPINFAALEMINKALKKRPVYPEVHKHQTGDLIRVVTPIYHPVQGKNQIVGTLIASYEVEKALQDYKPTAQSVGKITINQQFGKSKPMSVYANGTIAGQPLYEVALKGSLPHIRLNYSLGENFTSVHLNDIIYWSMIGLAGVLSMLSALLIFSILKKQMAADLISLEKHFKGVTSGKPIREPNFRNQSFHDTAKRILDLIDALVAMQHSRSSKSTSGSGNKTNYDEIDQIVGIEREEDELFGFADDEETATEDDESQEVQQQKPVKKSSKTAMAIPETIFRAYDIRGIFQESLTPEIIYEIGRAIGTEVREQNLQTIAVGRDGRLSGPELTESLIQGILTTGCDVVDVGLVPTPVLYYAAQELDSKSGVMVTGSHNPPNYNGLKIVINGKTLAGKEIKKLYQRTQAQKYAQGSGKESEQSMNTQYINRIIEDVILARPVNVVIDCGNGAAAAIATDLFTQLGCQITPLYCEVDGNFPNHHPDPSRPENMKALISAVEKTGAELGIAFDGDGDRLGIVTASGKMIFSDRVLMLFARDILSRNPGADIIFDVKCTRDLGDLISDLGGNPIMWKTGHSLIKAKLKETDAVLGGEMSGHFFFNDRWYGFDDALYSAARLMEIISMESISTDEIFDEFPQKESTPEINIPISEGKKFKVVEAIKLQGDFGAGKIIDTDGLRVDYPDSWGLVRASNTTPNLVARFEADNKQSLTKIMSIFKDSLLSVDKSLEVPF